MLGIPLILYVGILHMLFSPPRKPKLGATFLGHSREIQMGKTSLKQGCPGSVRLRFGDGTVRAVPVFERFRRFLCKKVFLCLSTVQEERTVRVPVSVPG